LAQNILAFEEKHARNCTTQTQIINRLLNGTGGLA